MRKGRWNLNKKFRRIKHGQKIIDIRPTARYNIVNLIRKPSDHCYKLNRNGGQLSELDGTE